MGLPPALELLAQSVSRRTGLAITVVSKKHIRFPTPIETVRYRIVQEALTNLRRHAKASHVIIRMQREAGAVRCLGKDDGSGFDTKAVLGRKRKRGLELLGVQTRVNALGGTFSIRSELGRRIDLILTIPFERKRWLSEFS